MEVPAEVPEDPELPVVSAGLEEDEAVIVEMVSVAEEQSATVAS